MSRQKTPGDKPIKRADDLGIPAQMAFALKENPFKKEIERVLNGETEFGRFIKPLADGLSKLPPERQTESLETFRRVYEFFKNNPADFKRFTREDALFLMTDPRGELIRRPAVHLYFTKKLDDSVKTNLDSKTEPEIKDAYLRRYRAQAWSRFVNNPRKKNLGDEILQNYPNEEIMVDDEAIDRGWREEIRQDVQFSFRMVQNANQIAYELYNEDVWPVVKRDFKRYYEAKVARAGDTPRDLFITDPAHTFGIEASTMQDSILVSIEMGKSIKLPPLVREASFMLVEDNPGHRGWTALLDKVGGLSRYMPRVDSTKVKGMLESGLGDDGCYKTAELALKAIEDNVAHGGSPPGIILSDIELGGGMDGIEFITKVKSRYPEVVVLMLWSSNPHLHRNRIQTLLKNGTINASFNKLEFDPRDFINTVNKELQKTP